MPSPLLARGPVLLEPATRARPSATDAFYAYRKTTLCAQSVPSVAKCFYT